MLFNIAVSLVLTLLAEVPFAALYGLKGKKLALTVLANIFTNPAANVVNYLLKAYTQVPPYITILAVEAAVILTEGKIYKSCFSDIKDPMVLSLALNGISYTLGGALATVF